MLTIAMISTLLGVAIGLVLALTGAGGTIIAIPILVFAFDLSVVQAAPIALLAIFLAASTGAIQGLRKGIVRYKSALLIAVIGMVFAPFGVKLAQNMPSQLLRIGLIGTLLYIGLRSWLSARHQAVDNSALAPPACMINPATSRLFWTASCTKRLIGTGIISGFLSGLLGVGGGFVIVPALNKVSNFNHATIVATTLTAVALISLSSIASHIQFSTIEWDIAFPFTVATTCAMLTTSTFISNKISNKASQQSFSLLCLIAIAYLSYSTIL